MSHEESEARPIVGYAAILVVVAMWTTFLLLSRHGAKGPLTSWDLAALRFTVSGVIMTPFLLRMGFGKLSISQALVLTFTAGLGFALFAYAGFVYAPASHGAILMPGVLPMMTAAIGYFWLGERLGPNRIFAMVLIIAGVLLTGWHSIGLPQYTILVGDILFLCAVTFWAVFTLVTRRWRVDPIGAAAIVAPLAMAIFLPFYLVFLPSNLSAVSWHEIFIQGAFQGVGAVIIVLLAYTTAVRHLGPQVTTMITAIVPALAAILAVPILSEPLEWSVVFGLALVTAGMIATVLTVKSPRSKRSIADRR